MINVFAQQGLSFLALGGGQNLEFIGESLERSRFPHDGHFSGVGRLPYRHGIKGNQQTESQSDQGHYLGLKTFHFRAVAAGHPRHQHTMRDDSHSRRNPNDHYYDGGQRQRKKRIDSTVGYYSHGKGGK